jgi:hypothetical protein
MLLVLICNTNESGEPEPSCVWKAESPAGLPANPTSKMAHGTPPSPSGGWYSHNASALATGPWCSCFLFDCGCFVGLVLVLVLVLVSAKKKEQIPRPSTRGGYCGGGSGG